MVQASDLRDLAALDGSSFNIYLYGGQNSIPFGSQIQYSDMWILTIPSFTWVQVKMDGQSQPPARAGHSCVLWDGQMVVIGGYVGTEIPCDSPGIYVFNASSLTWGNTFNALSAPSSTNDQGSSVVQGSEGYQVPALVQSVIGGNSAGAATATAPVVPATSGPIATGKPPTWTITQSGSTVIQTAHATSTVSGTPQTASPSTLRKNTGAIIAGVIAGALAILAAYLAFCTWLYRRQLGLYKNHVAVAQRTSFSEVMSPDHSEEHEKMGIAVAGGNAAMLGPFGTELSPRTSGARSSSQGCITPVTTDSNSITPSTEYIGISPGAVGMKGTSPYGRNSEADEWPASGRRPESWGRRGGSTGASSTDDLLSGQEPSFFSVVLNPRRTLKAVNFD